MRHALFVPPFDALADPRLLAELAVNAETAGWDGLFVWDHLLYSDPVRRIAEPWVCLAAIAAATERLRIGPMVTPLPRRRPAVLARQAASLDLLAGGRLTLGLGLGDDWGGEFSRFGDEGEPSRRAAQLDEGLAVVRELLSGRAVDHTGPEYTAQGVTFLPAAPEVPFWLGARWPNRAPRRRAARHQGVVAIQLEQPDDVRRLRDDAAADGADLDRWDVAVVARDGQEPAAWAAAGVTWWLTQVGPYHLDTARVRAVIDAGPPSEGAPA